MFHLKALTDLFFFLSSAALEEKVNQAAGAWKVLEILNYWTVTFEFDN